MAKNHRIHLSQKRIKLLRRPPSLGKISEIEAKIGREKEAGIENAKRKKTQGGRTKVMTKIVEETKRGLAREAMIERIRIKSHRRNNKIDRRTKGTGDLVVGQGHMIMTAVGAFNQFQRAISLGVTTSLPAKVVNQLILISNQ